MTTRDVRRGPGFVIPAVTRSAAAVARAGALGGAGGMTLPVFREALAQAQGDEPADNDTGTPVTPAEVDEGRDQEMKDAEGTEEERGILDVFDRLGE